MPVRVVAQQCVNDLRDLDRLFCNNPEFATTYLTSRLYIRREIYDETPADPVRQKALNLLAAIQQRATAAFVSDVDGCLHEQIEYLQAHGFIYSYIRNRGKTLIQGLCFNYEIEPETVL